MGRHLELALVSAFFSLAHILDPALQGGMEREPHEALRWSTWIASVRGEETEAQEGRGSDLPQVTLWAESEVSQVFSSHSPLRL